MTIARVRSATSSITNKVLEIGIKIMMITIKSKDGYNVDVTGIYLNALQNKITPQEYKSQLDLIANTNKNI